ncbi:MAG: hypothetical protein ABIH26_09725 [Candidatus Eisenbacteria bacterium]
MTGKLRKQLAIPSDRLKAINQYLTSPDNTLVDRFLAVVEKHGGVEEINRKAAESGKLKNLVRRLEETGSPYRKDLEWLAEKKEKGAFVPMEEYRAQALGGAKPKSANRSFAVTLEISALNFFPWLITEAKRAIEKRELMPGRFIRVRSMKESSEDQGDLLAVAAAMRVVGASYVETLDTKGTDGSNVHLGGPETITGYFGGVGQPNDYALKWVDEFLYYYTNYGTSQVLNINPGTVFLGYMLHKLGIDNEFKISVFMGNDNPYAVLWTLLAAKLFSREDGTTPLIGFNFSNSVNNETIELCAEVRGVLDFESVVRFEHHITETFKGIVRQPYNRRNELVEVARKVKNISAKHEGGDPEIDEKLEHPSNILEYFMPKKDIEAQGLMPFLERNYMEKHIALNRTARALLKSGIPVIAAKHLHK